MKSYSIQAFDVDFSALERVLGPSTADRSRPWQCEIVIPANGAGGLDEEPRIIRTLLSRLDGKDEELKSVGADRSDFSIWLIYQYDGQCNMEFHPESLRLLADSGLVFCVSCYDVGDDASAGDE